MSSSAYVVRWDSLPDFKKAFPTIQIPESTDALGIEVTNGRVTLLEAFCEDAESCFDQAIPVNDDLAESLAGFAHQFGDPCLI